jgi:hypothetical protein
MLRPMLLAAAVIAIGSVDVAARDRYYRDYGYSRADDFQRRAEADGRVTKDEWRILQQLRAEEAYRGRRYGYRGYSRADEFQRRAEADGRVTKDEWRIIQRLRAEEGY